MTNIQPLFERTEEKRNDKRTRDRPYRTNELEQTENEMKFVMRNDVEWRQRGEKKIEKRVN